MAVKDRKYRIERYFSTSIERTNGRTNERTNDNRYIPKVWRYPLMPVASICGIIFALSRAITMVSQTVFNKPRRSYTSVLYTSSYVPSHLYIILPPVLFDIIVDLCAMHFTPSYELVYSRELSNYFHRSLETFYPSKIERYSTYLLPFCRSD